MRREKYFPEKVREKENVGGCGGGGSESL